MRSLTCLLVAAVLSVDVPAGTAARSLDIYFIDVEGGQSTLLVTPAGETLLVDAGFPGAGTFQSKPADPRGARDAPRIAAAVHDAGAARIDYLLVTHFHADHDGGVAELAQLVPISTFVDHGRVLPQAEQTVRGTLEAFNVYAAIRDKARHLEPKPGDRLPLKGLDVRVVSTAGTVIRGAIRGAGRRSPACGLAEVKPQEPNENPRSTGIRVQFGKFRFLDIGDLTGKPLHDLACPTDLIGPVDVYLVAHHGGVDAADPATMAVFRSRVAIINNGATKGGAPETLAALRRLPDTDVWQLHRSMAAGADNVADDRIANLDDRTAHWIKLRAHADGSFDVTNGRTGVTRRYSAQ